MSGNLYVYTKKLPCQPTINQGSKGKKSATKKDDIADNDSNGEDTDGISCLKFYAEIAKMYNADKSSDDQLKIHIIFSEKYGKDYAEKYTRNSQQLEAKIAEKIRCTNSAKGGTYQAERTNIYVKRI